MWPMIRVWMPSKARRAILSRRLRLGGYRVDEQPTLLSAARPSDGLLDAVVFEGPAASAPVAEIRAGLTSLAYAGGGLPMIAIGPPAQGDTADLVTVITSETPVLDALRDALAPDWPELLGKPLAYGQLTFDRMNWITAHGEERLHLTRSEGRALALLMRRPEEVIPHTELRYALGDGRGPITAAALARLMSRLQGSLRATAAGNPVRAVRGLGYVLDSAPGEDRP